jgi:hypothetical protein
MIQKLKCKRGNIFANEFRLLKLLRRRVMSLAGIFLASAWTRSTKSLKNGLELDYEKEKPNAHVADRLVIDHLARLQRGK